MRRSARWGSRIVVVSLLTATASAGAFAASTVPAVASQYVSVSPASNLVLTGNGDASDTPSANVTVTAAPGTFDANSLLGIVECSADYDWLGDAWPGEPPSNLCYSSNTGLTTANATGGLDATSFNVVGGFGYSDPRAHPDGGLGVNPYDPNINPSVPVNGVSCPTAPWEVSPPVLTAAMSPPRLHQLTPRDYCVVAVANVSGLDVGANFNIVGFPNEWEPTPITFASIESTQHQSVLDIPIVSATETWAAATLTSAAGYTFTYRTATSHFLSVGNRVQIKGVTGSHNGQYTQIFNRSCGATTATCPAVRAVPTATTFTIFVPAAVNIAGVNAYDFGGQLRPVDVTAASWTSANGGTISYTVPNSHGNPYPVGAKISISGMLPAGYNVTNATVASIVTPTFTVTGVPDPGPLTRLGTLDSSTLSYSDPLGQAVCFLADGGSSWDGSSCTMKITRVTTPSTIPNTAATTATQGLDLPDAFVTPATTPAPYTGGSEIVLGCPSTVVRNGVTVPLQNGQTIPANQLVFRAADIGHFVSSSFIPAGTYGAGFADQPRILGVFNNPKSAFYFGCEELLIDRPFQNTSPGTCINPSPQTPCADPSATTSPSWDVHVGVRGFAPNDALAAIVTDSTNSGCVPKSFNSLVTSSGYDGTHFTASAVGAATQTISLYSTCMQAGDDLGITVTGEPEITRENRFLFSFNIPDVFGSNAARADTEDLGTLPDPGPNATECDRAGTTFYCGGGG